MRCCRLLVPCVDEADVHVKVTVLVEAWQTQRDPIFTPSGLDTVRLEEHVEDKLEVAGMQRVPPRPDYADQPSACHYQSIEQAVTPRLKHGIIDDLAVRFANLETFER